MRIVVARLGAEGAGEDLGNVAAQLVHGRHDDVARRLVVELLDALAEVGLGDDDAVRHEMLAHPALLGQHRLRLDEGAGARPAQDVENDRVVLGRVARPVHGDAVLLRLGLEPLEVGVEVGERVLLDRGRQLAQLLPFGDGVGLPVALDAQVPQPLVVELQVLRRGQEALGRLGVVDAAATHLGAARLRLARTFRPGVGLQRLALRLGVAEALAVLAARRPVVAGTKLAMEELVRQQLAHCVAPLRTCAMWMNFMGVPARSAQPF